MSKRSTLLQELRDTGTAELKERLRGARDEVFRLRFQQASKQLASPARVREARKNIARILSILSEREEED
jgi:large subunit ribosomal protein L29